MNSLAKKLEFEPSCGILRPKDGTWLRKPAKIPLQIPTEKGVPNTVLYNNDQLSIGINHGDDNTVISATKGKKAIAILVVPAVTMPLELAVGDTGLEVLCNTTEPLIKIRPSEE